MPISFARSGWVGYLSPAYRDWVAKIILATKTIPKSMDATGGALYRCAAAGTAFFDRVRGVRNVYVITDFSLVGHQYQGNSKKEVSGVDVRFHGAYYSILCERLYGPPRDIPIQILRIDAPRQPEARESNHKPELINPVNPGGGGQNGVLVPGGGSASQYANAPHADQYANFPESQYANNPASNYGTIIPVNSGGIYANIPTEDESPYANFPENYHADNNGLIR